MSRPSIKFVYSGEIRSNVIEAQRGPLMLNNLLDTYLRPQYEQIRLNQSQSNSQSQPYPNMQPTFPFAGSVDKPRLNESQPNATRDIPQIEQARLNGSQPKLQNNLPSISTVDVNSKSGSLMRSKSADFFGIAQLLAKQNKDVEAVPEQPMPQPTINIDEINESEFVKRPVPNPKKKKTPMIGETDQIVLKAPSFKFQPREDGVAVRGGKNQFQKAEKTEKYFYKGIPEKTENDFVGCFGCMEPKVKAYTASVSKKR